MEILQNTSDILRDRMSSYSAYVLLNRAIPNMFDGMKPVTRRILYSMYKHKSYNYTKSANVAGRIMMIHPHGSTYSSIVGMVQSDRHIHPLLEGKGNFGQYTSSDLQPAADRYSEVRLSEISKTMLQNFDKNIVDFEDNYDGTQRVPKVLPVKYPNILTQAQKGIGVGFSSSIPSYNLKEVCEATIDIINNKEILIIPDFATGGYIENDKEQFENIMKYGSGSVNLRCKYEVNDNEIIITEIPYGVKREKVIDDIIKNVKNNNIPYIKKVNDLTGLGGLNISISLKKNVDIDLVMSLLYKYTPLENKYSVNMNMLIDNKLKVVGVEEVIKKWISWRKDCVKRGLIHDVDNLAKKVHLYEGLKLILLDIDKAIEIVRNTSSNIVKDELKKEFNIDEIQSEEVLKMPLRNINKDYLEAKINEIDDMKKSLDNLKKYRDSDKLQLKIIEKGLNEIVKEFSKNRRTIIKEFKSDEKIKEAIEDLKETNNNKEVSELILTKQGFLYKNYKTQDIKLSPGDEIISNIKSNDNDFVYILFKNSNEAIGISVDEIKESNSKKLGDHINNYNSSYENDTPMLLISRQETRDIIYIFDNGKGVKFNGSQFDVKRKTLKRAKFDNPLLYVDIVSNDYDIDIKTEKGKKNIKINTKDIAKKQLRYSAGNYITKNKIVNISKIG